MSSEGEDRAGARRRVAPVGRRRVTPGRVLLGLAVLLVVLAGVSAWQAVSAYRHLTAAADQVPALRDQLLDGDPGELASAAAAFRDDTAQAREALDGPQWAVLARLPAVGDDVTAVRTVTEVVDDLAEDAFTPLVQARGIVDPEDLRPRNGRIPLEPLREAGPYVGRARAAVEAADERLAGLEVDGLAERLRGPVTELADKVGELRGTTRAVDQAVELLPPMLGSDGPRTYLVLVQNNAEPRALGGIAGAVIELRAANGRLRLVAQRPASSFGGLEQPVLPLTPGERAVYGTQLGRYMQNVTATPDFPRAAQLARAMWRRGTGEGGVDGVMAIDPVALQGLIGATGPVRLPDGTRLTARNTAATLLNKVYLDIADPQAQDRFFAVAAAGIFEKLTSGGVDVPAAVDTLADSARAGRVLLWSDRAEEQETIAGTAVAGTLEGRQDGSPVVGVYLFDRSAAKIAYYEDMDVRVRPVSCDGDTHQVDVAVTLTSNVPEDVSRLPDYLSGGGNAVDVGDISSALMVYAPRGGLITGVRDSDKATPVTTNFHDGLYVAARTFLLRPGESVTLHYRMAVPATDGAGDLVVRTTPGPAADRFGLDGGGCPT